MLYTKEKIEDLQNRWTTTKGKKLIKVIKDSNCYLSPVLFREKIKNFPGINDDEVEDGIDLRGIQLSGFDFRVSIQDDDEGFAENLAILSNLHLEGAILKHCTFQDGKLHDCYFEHAELEHSNFQNTSLSNCFFQEADLAGMDLHGAKLINCDFNDAKIKDITLSSTIVDQKTTFGRDLHSEKEGNHRFASIEYKQIKEMYKNSSLHDLADQYHYKEMVAKRKIVDRKHPKRWLNFLFGDLLCKYGTSFNRVLFWSIIIIIACAILYTSDHSLLFQNTEIVPSFLDSLYFSIVTFTTLGYGDFHAIDGMRYIAAIEAFVGAAMMSLFTVIVARTIIRD
ncbi:pentapeptide repeat-containing protein [Patescibacteria group bacterium]|nr:pentapeptide repeat-containing protein [Patescibacteria group bacterium]